MRVHEIRFILYLIKLSAGKWLTTCTVTVNTTWLRYSHATFGKFIAGAITKQVLYLIAATINSRKNSSVSVKPGEGHGPAVVDCGATSLCWSLKNAEVENSFKEKQITEV